MAPVHAELDVGGDVFVRSQLLFIEFSINILENYIEFRRTSGLNSFNSSPDKRERTTKRFPQR